MEVDNDSSDSDGYGYGNNQEAIVIPIRRRNDQAAPAEVEGFSTDNGVTMINFAKSKQVVCDKCSVSLKSMKCLEKHMKDKHNDLETCFYCSECGISKATKKQLQNHERSHKTAVCPHCNKVLTIYNKLKHIEFCRGSYL